MMNKKGWMRILEATIAVLIVSGVLIVAHLGQVDKRDSLADYFYSLQKQILMDVALRDDLRLNVLNVEEENLDDDDFSALNSFIDERVPDAFGYSVRVCKLGSGAGFCKMDSVTYIATMEKNVFVEDVIISAEVGEGEGEQVYSPRKLKLFIWEKD